MDLEQQSEGGIDAYFKAKLGDLEIALNEKAQNNIIRYCRIKLIRWSL